MNSEGTGDAEAEISRYTKLYKENSIGWHKNEVNPILEGYMTVFGHEISSKSICIPLCGKTKDIPFLMSMGWRVFGIEAVQQAIEELDRENNLGLKYNKQESTYSTVNNELIIFHGDIFKCPIEKWGPFDAVWDRGSFSVMTYDQRAPYIEKMQSGLRTSMGDYGKFTYLLSVYDYDKSLNDSPPRACSPEDMELYFGNWTNIHNLEETQATERFLSRFKAMAGKQCRQNVYMITRKSVQ